MEVLEMQNDFEHMAANAEQAARILLCPLYSYEMQMAIAFTFLAIEAVLYV